MEVSSRNAWTSVDLLQEGRISQVYVLVLPDTAANGHDRAVHGWPQDIRGAYIEFSLSIVVYKENY